MKRDSSVVLHPPVLPVIPMPGEELAHGRHPIFAPTAVFWRLQPGQEQDLQRESEEQTPVLGTFFKLEWRAAAAVNSCWTSSSAPVSFAAFDKLIVFVSATSWGCCSRASMRVQLNCKARFMLALSCSRHFFHPVTASVRYLLTTPTF